VNRQQARLADERLMLDKTPGACNTHCTGLERPIALLKRYASDTSQRCGPIRFVRSTMTYDYVIIGGGTAGCVLANRLTECGRYSVLLLEAGPRDDYLWIHIPIGYAKTMFHPVYNWGFYTEPDPGMNQRKIYWPRGRGLGGSSSINGLIAIRGHRADYDGWAALGNAGWAWDDVLPYFIKSEHTRRERLSWC
jgi:choline dehydrogenase-like flavoprotein